MIKHAIIIMIFSFSVMLLSAQGASQHVGSQNIVIRIDNGAGWSKFDPENNPNSPVPAQGNENVAYSSNANGIFITILSGTNKIKLFALTGQLLLNGDLTQGRFFIPTRQGIYFLRINTKSYKVICK